MITTIGVALALGNLTQKSVIEDIAYRANKFFWEQSHPVTGLTKDRAANFGVDSYDVASIAATGFGLVSFAVSAEHGYYLRSECLTKARRVASFLRNSASHNHGWFYHFVNWANGQRVWQSEASSIDTSIAIAGLIVAERYFQDAQLTADTNAILQRVDWQWMLTDNGAKPNEKFLCHGWKPETGFLPYRWDSYSEELMLYVQALGAWPGMPLTGYDALSRPYVPYENLLLLVGGPLFMHQLSHNFLDFKFKRDHLGWDYWVEARNATLANRKYCMNNPQGFAGYSSSSWGLTACDSPTGYGAFGAPGWINDNGTLAPTCSIASLPFTPNESLVAAKNWKLRYGYAYGRYGFSNGINVSANWRDPDVIGIDLGMMICGYENYLNNFVNDLSAQHPWIQTGMARAGFHVTNEGKDPTARPLRL